VCGPFVAASAPARCPRLTCLSHQEPHSDSDHAFNQKETSRKWSRRRKSPLISFESGQMGTSGDNGWSAGLSTWGSPEKYPGLDALWRALGCYGSVVWRHNFCVIMSSL
jgi:hypothetical protein